MVNPTGANGHNNGTCPSNEKLSALLHDYAHHGLSLSERLQYLEQAEYKIGKSTLKTLNAKFNVPTVNKPPPLPVAATLVAKHVSEISTVGHIYLDFMEKYGMTCEKLTVDSGSETGEMYACHQALQSVDSMEFEGYFQPNKELHIFLFHWIWSKVVQAAVDDFVQYWNNKKTHHQHQANIPTGSAPNVIFDFPQNYALRETIPCTQEECYQWVPIEFEGTAQNAYVNLNSPILNHTTGWKVRTISLYLRSGKAIQIARVSIGASKSRQP
ncbi:hypothetical protein BDP27DRAFT_1435501 [Rhodocollybia butyracea]|uniref:Uncharacterized protein n=1 Tax=Rhodocollybia butyracea TaxID=206335 RepID=A0A9P5P798_9AGAR|nr:hypothetical protein BDP27DRAFT_1435501 [Rhodocollybia butyracea]